MYSKLVCLAAFVAVAVANIHHSPAYSSVHVNKHDGHAAIVHLPYAPAHGYYGHGYGLGHGLGYGLGHGLGHGVGHGVGHGHGGYGHGYEYGHQRHNIDYYTYPKYEFEYKVVDHHTGDIKAQAERRYGDVVRGYYALHQPDGSERSVHYASDDHSGFRANVRYGTHHLYPVHHYPHH